MSLSAASPHAAETASGASTRAAPIASAKILRNTAECLGKIPGCTESRGRHPIIGNTIGNFVADRVAGGGRALRSPGGSADDAPESVLYDGPLIPNRPVEIADFLPDLSGVAGGSGLGSLARGSSGAGAAPVANGEAGVSADQLDIVVKGDRTLGNLFRNMQPAVFSQLYLPQERQLIAERDAFENSNDGYTYNLLPNKRELAASLNLRGNLAIPFSYMSFLGDTDAINKKAVDTKIGQPFNSPKDFPISFFDYQMAPPRIITRQLNAKGVALGGVELGSTVIPLIKGGRLLGAAERFIPQSPIGN